MMKEGKEYRILINDLRFQDEDEDQDEDMGVEKRKAKSTLNSMNFRHFSSL
jgi:hypothetical protein